MNNSPSFSFIQWPTRVDTCVKNMTSMIYTGVNFGTALKKGYRQAWPNKPNSLLFLYVSLEKKFIGFSSASRCRWLGVAADLPIGNSGATATAASAHPAEHVRLLRQDLHLYHQILSLKSPPWPRPRSKIPRWHRRPRWPRRFMLPFPLILPWPNQPRNNPRVTRGMCIA
jgi:hypothetical protein